MADKVIVADLVVRGRVGHTPAERAHPQDIWVDLEMHTDVSKASASDRIEDTVDYVAAAGKVQEVLDAGPYNLAERVAETVAAALLKDFPIQEVTVRIKKKTVPNAAFAVVEITRP